MGNDSSHLSGLEINEKAVEITDFWAHYHATVNDSGYFFNLRGYGSISVFKCEAAVLGSLWTHHTPLEKCAINLMKYRHPNILRYVWHWQQRGVQCLATEAVQPLSQLLPTQETLQICVGLNQIAHALEFLHTNAHLSHNNVCVGSIYVLPDGCWKLGGMEFAKPFTEMTSAYVKQSKKYRYEKAVNPNEEMSDDFTTIDQFAFGSLVEDVFKGRNEDDLPHWKEFKKYCHQELQNPVTNQRPMFSSILKQDFLNHDFISVHQFLSTLPVKTESEKTRFFNGLLDKLRSFSQEMVAKQLSGLLLSRLVLLDPTARDKLLPHVLIPKSNGVNKLDHGLFSLSVFKNHITPQLLKMFRVRDVQVRLLLLKHFPGFSSAFTKEDLTTHVLPELLLGIKDTSDTLVSMTLYCLADLVPVLGASTVIGGKRSKLFADGRPLSHPRIKNEMAPHKVKLKHPVVLDKIDEESREGPPNQNPTLSAHAGKLPVGAVLQEEISYASGDSIEIENVLFLHERPSPDGGEDFDNEALQNRTSDNVEEEQWSDWETEENTPNERLKQADHNEFTVEDKNQLSPAEDKAKTLTNDSFYLQKAALDAKAKKLADLSELDIKSKKFNMSRASSSNKDEFDFFLDMEPVIEKPNVLNIEEQLKDVEIGDSSNERAATTTTTVETLISSKLSFTPAEVEDTKTEENDAWGDGDWND